MSHLAHTVRRHRKLRSVSSSCSSLGPGGDKKEPNLNLDLNDDESISNLKKKRKNQLNTTND